MRNIVDQKSADFDPSKFEDRYESALTELLNQKRAGVPIKAHARARPDSNVVDLMTALKQSLEGGSASKTNKPIKKAPGQREMLMPISNKKEVPKQAAKPATAAKKKSARKRAV